jgi:hypothetical protein
MWILIDYWQSNHCGQPDKLARVSRRLGPRVKEDATTTVAAVSTAWITGE